MDLGYHMCVSSSKDAHVAPSPTLLRGLKIQHQLSSLCFSHWPNRETRKIIEKDKISLSGNQIASK